MSNAALSHSALLHLDEPGMHLSAALLAGLGETMRNAFTHIYAIATIILAVSIVPAIWLREMPLRGR